MRAKEERERKRKEKKHEGKRYESGKVICSCGHRRSLRAHFASSVRCDCARKRISRRSNLQVKYRRDRSVRDGGWQCKHFARENTKDKGENRVCEFGETPRVSSSIASKVCF